MKHAVIPALLVLVISSAAAAQSVQPGLWKAKSSLDLNGIPLPASEHEECVSHAAAKDLRKSIAKELKKKGCELTKWTVKNKKLDATLKCKNDDLEAEGALTGTVSPKSYDLSGKAEGTFKMIPSIASLKLSGEWMKNCKR